MLRGWDFIIKRLVPNLPFSLFDLVVGCVHFLNANLKHFSSYSKYEHTFFSSSFQIE